MTLWNLLIKLDLESQLEVLDADGYLIQKGIRGPTMWQDDLLDKEVDLILPGIVTKIFLEGYHEKTTSC